MALQPPVLRELFVAVIVHPGHELAYPNFCLSVGVLGVRPVSAHVVTLETPPHTHTHIGCYYDRSGSFRACAAAVGQATEPADRACDAASDGGELACGAELSAEVAELACGLPMAAQCAASICSSAAGAGGLAQAAVCAQSAARAATLAADACDAATRTSELLSNVDV